MKSIYITVLVVGLFFLSRTYVLLNPPYIEGTATTPGKGYSDVKQDSERYANMWHYGLTPYRKHMYEYPPIAIPFVYLPLLADLNGFGRYYPNYRFEIFLFEIILFAFLIKTTGKIWKKEKIRQWIALIFYCLIGLIGKDFWYDGLDLLFIGFYSLALMVRYLTGHKKLWHKVCFWALFSASFGVKYMTLPLALPLLWLSRKRWKQEIIAGAIGFALIWGAPILMYRSSLSVMVLFHTARPFNYGSFGKWLVLAINDFTHTEIQTDILPHYPVVGPVAQMTEKFFSFAFVLSSISAIIWSTWRAHALPSKCTREEELRFIILTSLLFFMTIFLTNKVFSNPFHIWYAPLIVLLPLGSFLEQTVLMLGASWMFILDTTPLIRVPTFWIRLRDATRFIPMFGILVWSRKQVDNP